MTGHNFEVETETFKLRNIMEAPLLKYKEEIEVFMNCQDEEIIFYILLKKTLWFCYRISVSVQ